SKILFPVSNTSRQATAAITIASTIKEGFVVIGQHLTSGAANFIVLPHSLYHFPYPVRLDNSIVVQQGYELCIVGSDTSLYRHAKAGIFFEANQFYAAVGFLQVFN